MYDNVPRLPDRRSAARDTDDRRTSPRVYFDLEASIHEIVERLTNAANHERPEKEKGSYS